MKIRRLATVTLCALGVALGAAGTAAAYHEGEHSAVSKDQLPDAVQSAIDQKAKGGTVPLIEKFTRDGKTLFRAHIEKDGKITDVDLDQSGNTVPIE